MSLHKTVKMHTLWLTEAHARAIVEQARAAGAFEVCGLIAGRAGQAVRVIPVPNSAEDPQHFYEMDSAELARHLPAIEREGLEVIAFYHSHPEGDPIPSQTDIREAYYPDTAYLIVGLRGGDARFGAWQIRHRQVTPIPVHIGTLPPPRTVNEDTELSKSQRVAVVTTGIIAVIALILVSIYLLPPAPPIP